MIGDGTHDLVVDSNFINGIQEVIPIKERLTNQTTLESETPDN